MAAIAYLFGVAMLGFGIFWLVLTYRYRSRGDVWPAIAHAAALIVVGLLVLAAAVNGSGALLGVAGVLLLVDSVARTVLARRRRRLA
jgi:uncharacterized membrane protein HdeD (DUF308 family)